MRKYLTILNGRGSELIITDTGIEKISTPFLFTDSPFEYLYLETLSQLLFKPGTYHIDSYELIDLNEEIKEPYYPIVEALILFNQQPELGIEYIEKIRKQFDFPVTYDYIDYYMLSKSGIFYGGETPLSWDNLTTYKNIPLILLNGYSSVMMYDILTYMEEGYSREKIDSYIINISSYYPIDFYALDGEVYEFNIKNKKLKSTGIKVNEIEKENLFRYSDMESIIMLSPHELTCNRIINKQKLQSLDCYLENFTIRSDMIILETDKKTIKLKPYHYKMIFSKPMNNYNLKKLIQEEFDTENNLIKITPGHVIPYRFDNDFNPLLITYSHLIKEYKTNYTKNYLFSVLSSEL